MTTVDSHHHFWRYDAGEYSWITDEMRAIRRDFLPEHLRAELSASGIDGVVSVQARTSMEETRWLLDLARRHDFISGVVGWFPLTAQNLVEELAGLGAESKLVGVREVLQGLPEGAMMRNDFNEGLAKLREFSLSYDLLIFERQLPEAARLVDRHPGQIFVLDHMAKPLIKNRILEPWKTNIRELARRENVYCKVSGMVTEADYAHWSEEQLRPYWEAVLEAFGPQRLMFGSDWPVCLAACAYGRWREIAGRFASELSEAEKTCLFGGTAHLAYGLNKSAL